MKTCYNCGKQLRKEEVTKEHIPAKTLFEGYSEDYKLNRITVPSCEKCNNSYCKIDEEFRNLIGIIENEENITSEIRKNAANSILRGQGINRIKIYNAELMSIDFKDKDVRDFHIKNFKGIYYKSFNISFPSDLYDVVVNIDSHDWSTKTLQMIAYLKNHFKWKFSGHPNIFQYIIQPFREDIFDNKIHSDLVLQDNEKVLMAIISYNNSHAALIVAVLKKKV